MSQNDYVIANQTTPLFRADLNTALQALASNSSGATAPATTYANMLWYDTATNILKMRSEADDAWIDLGTLDQSANTFAPAGIATQTTAVWEAGTDTTESLVSAAKVAAAIAAQASGGWEAITTVTLSGATQIDFTGFDASRYDDYEIVFRDVDMSDALQPAIQIQMSTDGGSTFASGSTDYASLTYIANLNNTEAQTVNGDTDAPAVLLGYNGSSTIVAERSVFGFARIHAPASNAVTCVDFVIVGKSFSATDEGFCERRGTGIYKGDNIVNAVRVSELRASTFNSGQIELRGRVK